MPIWSDVVNVVVGVVTGAFISGGVVTVVSGGAVGVFTSGDEIVTDGVVGGVTTAGVVSTGGVVGVVSGCLLIKSKIGLLGSVVVVSGG